jgi:hypothetical protein
MTRFTDDEQVVINAELAGKLAPHFLSSRQAYEAYTAIKEVLWDAGWWVTDTP